MVWRPFACQEWRPLSADQACSGPANDVDNRAAVAAVPTDELDLVGFAVAGDRRTVDKALDKLRLHS